MSSNNNVTGADEPGFKCNNFPHITPMTEEQTKIFFDDKQNMTRDELHNKWQHYAVESNAETDKIVFGDESILSR
jgi:hypothetical protein